MQPQTSFRRPSISPIGGYSSEELELLSYYQHLLFNQVISREYLLHTLPDPHWKEKLVVYYDELPQEKKDALTEVINFPDCHSDYNGKFAWPKWSPTKPPAPVMLYRCYFTSSQYGDILCTSFDLLTVVKKMLEHSDGMFPYITRFVIPITTAVVYIPHMEEVVLIGATFLKTLPPEDSQEIIFPYNDELRIIGVADQEFRIIRSTESREPRPGDLQYACMAYILNGQSRWGAFDVYYNEDDLTKLLHYYEALFQEELTIEDFKATLPDLEWQRFSLVSYLYLSNETQRLINDYVYTDRLGISGPRIDVDVVVDKMRFSPADFVAYCVTTKDTWPPLNRGNVDKPFIASFNLLKVVEEAAQIPGSIILRIFVRAGHKAIYISGDEELVFKGAATTYVVDRRDVVLTINGEEISLEVWDLDMPSHWSSPLDAESIMNSPSPFIKNLIGGDASDHMATSKEYPEDDRSRHLDESYPFSINVPYGKEYFRFSMNTDEYLDRNLDQKFNWYNKNHLETISNYRMTLFNEVTDQEILTATLPSLEWLELLVDEFYRLLTRDERDVVYKYTDYSYIEFNKMLRNDPNSNAIMNDFIERMTPSPTDFVVYRGDTRHPRSVDEFAVDGYLSTSLDLVHMINQWICNPKQDKAAFYRIFVPAGTRALYVPSKEQELIFKHGTGLRMIGMRRVMADCKDGIKKRLVVYDMEMIN